MQFFRTLLRDSLLKNAFYLMATNLTNLLLGFIFWVIAAIYYSPDEIGTISAVLSSMFLIAMISSLGFTTSLIFYLPRDRKNASKMINSCIIASIAVSVLFSSIYILGIDIWTPALGSIFGNLESDIIFMAVTIFSTISSLISSAFTAGKRSSFHMTKETVFGSLKILPLPLLAGFGAMGIFLSWGVGLLLSLILSLVLLSIVWKGYLPRLTLDPIIKSMAGYSAWNYLADLFYSLPRFVLPILIVNLISPESTGFFFIAFMVAGLLYGIPQSITNSLLAETSDGGKLWDKVGRAIRFNAALVIPGFLLFVFFGKFVLNLFNPNYAQNASTTLTILAAASLPLSINTIFMGIRNSQKKVKSVVKINLAISVITFVLVVPFIKVWGLNGAAAAYFVANVVCAIAVIYWMSNPAEFISNQFKYNRKEGSG
ncbi:MAG: polysaccharide biosynthesis C-terminal domain-containing protein [Candidatus Methanoperedens sp.]|nr:polysaccharide biosynthesis C-terminal domain-containing protein [Candidatus Methanoperedens sp.]MCE8428511.1 polysaccharide biosynthesis C-terminal domain-containing protein [Candidatus Methanoperedens sp.]